MGLAEGCRDCYRYTQICVRLVGEPLGAAKWMHMHLPVTPSTRLRRLGKRPKPSMNGGFLEMGQSR